MQTGNRIGLGGLLGTVLLAAVPGMAQPAPAQPCAVTVEGSGWNSPVALGSLAAERDGGPVLEIGQTARITLHPTAEVRYPQPPGQAGKDGSFGGMVRFRVTAGGSYRFISSEDPWYDVVGSGGIIAPVARSHDRQCTPQTRKMIDYVLGPGDYLLEIARTSTADVVLLLTGLP